MFNVFPFENSITVMYLSGSEVQETLDFVARKSAERGCRTQAQVAGITFDMVCKRRLPDPIRRRPTPTACAKNIYLGDNCRGGNPDGPIDPTRCAPLVPTGLYRSRSTTTSPRGGSGFDVLKRNTSKQYTGISLRDALIDYLRQQPTCADEVIDITDPRRRPRSGRCASAGARSPASTPRSSRTTAASGPSSSDGSCRGSTP